MQNSLSQNLLHSTTRIVADTGSVGTGFFLSFLHMHKGENIEIPVLITNKHVVNQANNIQIVISVYENDGIHPQMIMTNIPLINNVLFSHPDNDIDLCAIILAPLLQELQNRHYKIDIFPFIEEQIYINGKQKGHDLSSMQEIYMTGYPNGLWDEKNNRPLTRRGLTASDLNVNWNDKQEFVVDMACFPGSSGSPIYVYNDGPFTTGGSLVHGTRLILLGILYAGPRITTNGEIKIEQIPTNYKYLAQTPMMMNLGFVIKAKELFILKKLIIDQLN